MEFIAVIGSALLALCSVPLAWQCWHAPEEAKSLNGYFLHMWAAGEVLTSLYVVHQGYWILMINYGVNLLGLAVVYWRRYK